MQRRNFFKALIGIPLVIKALPAIMEKKKKNPPFNFKIADEKEVKDKEWVDVGKEIPIMPKIEVNKDVPPGYMYMIDPKYLEVNSDYEKMLTGWYRFGYGVSDSATFMKLNVTA